MFKSNKKLKYPLIYLITDSSIFSNEKEFLNSLKIAVEAKVDVIQLREKKLSTIKLYNLATKIKEITHNTDTALIINDRIDVMLAIDADGIHLGYKSLPIDKARNLISYDKILGISMHSIEEVKKIKAYEADYVTLSPIFPTPKMGKIISPLGILKLKEAILNSKIPIIALGGINENNLEHVMESGASGAAFIRGILQKHDIAKQIYDLKNICNRFNSLS